MKPTACSEIFEEIDNYVRVSEFVEIDFTRQGYGLCALCNSSGDDPVGGLCRRCGGSESLEYRIADLLEAFAARAPEPPDGARTIDPVDKPSPTAR